jgi:hypothetical protein
LAHRDIEMWQTIDQGSAVQELHAKLLKEMREVQGAFRESSGPDQEAGKSADEEEDQDASPAEEPADKGPSDAQGAEHAAQSGAAGVEPPP